MAVTRRRFDAVRQEFEFRDRGAPRNSPASGERRARRGAKRSKSMPAWRAAVKLNNSPPSPRGPKLSWRES
ncbi:hypothetical protein N7535_001553 [Penicillium sp. DV-2018c]|nr:hypothetical protein N7461_005203 [Penicillium sp. DV-2018c]KAJ5582933.1 hypothetical protein N7535_001553 [Penicillium sp. DV-2018c]